MIDYGHRIQIPNPNTIYSRCAHPLIMQLVIACCFGHRLGRKIMLDERLVMVDNEGVWTEFVTCEAMEVTSRATISRWNLFSWPLSFLHFWGFPNSLFIRCNATPILHAYDHHPVCYRKLGFGGYQQSIQCLVARWAQIWNSFKLYRFLCTWGVSKIIIVFPCCVFIILFSLEWLSEQTKGVLS
jgi:hypothetical protein